MVRFKITFKRSGQTLGEMGSSGSNGVCDDILIIAQFCPRNAKSKRVERACGYLLRGVKRCKLTSTNDWNERKEKSY